MIIIVLFPKMWLKKWSGVDRPRQVTQRSPWTQVKIKHLSLYRPKGIIWLLLTDLLKFLLIQKCEFSCVSNSSLKRRGLIFTVLWWENFLISTIFLDRDGHLHCRTMEKTMGYRLVSVCNLAQESHTWQLSRFFFCHIYRTKVVEIQEFRYHGNVT